MTASAPPDRGRQLVQDLVDANRILFHQGVVDSFGHVSARHEWRPDCFLLARNMAPASVEQEDIIEFDLDCTPRHVDRRKLYLERFIHGEIYRARPDVSAIVHSHSPSVLPFSVVKGARLRAACHMCGFLGDGADIFDIREGSGEATDLLIRDRQLGRALAERLGSANVILMRGHGSTVVGPTLKQAVYRAVYTEVNARLVSDALRLGSVEYLTADEAKAALSIEKEIERPWQAWKAAARRTRMK
jgi:ribulose-5-phosphate 4-epimerase/fuculose-1-phosphate aldolase